MGCSAEEKGGKIALVKASLFANIYTALLLYLSNRTEIFRNVLAMRALRVEFFRKASHTAAAPHLGINALDAVVLTFTNLNALRQQLREDARIHGVTTDGGRAPISFRTMRLRGFAFERSISTTYTTCNAACWPASRPRPQLRAPRLRFTRRVRSIIR